MKLADIANKKINTNEGLMKRVGDFLDPSISISKAKEMTDPSGPYRKNVEEFLKKTVGNKYWLANVGFSNISYIRSTAACIDGRSTKEPAKLLGGLEKGTQSAEDVVRRLAKTISLRRSLIRQIISMGPKAKADDINKLFTDNQNNLPVEEKEYIENGGRQVKGITGRSDEAEDGFPYRSDYETFTSIFHPDTDNLECPNDNTYRQYVDVIGGLLKLLDQQNKVIAENTIPRFDETPGVKDIPGVSNMVKFRVFYGGHGYLAPMLLMRNVTHTLLADMVHAIWPKR